MQKIVYNFTIVCSMEDTLAWQFMGPITNPTVVTLLNAMNDPYNDLTLFGYLVVTVSLAVVIGVPVGIFFFGRWIGKTVRSWKRDGSLLKRRRRNRNKDIRLPPRGLAQR